MKKLRLEVDDLNVETFPTTERKNGKGTVVALDSDTDETFQCQTFTDCSFAATKNLCCTPLGICRPPITD